MFSNFQPEVLEFNSNWKKKYVTKELETQTDTYKIVHRGINTYKIQAKECQTDAYLFVEEDIHADIEEVDLMDFIKKVSPRIINTLLNNEKSTAFNSYKVNLKEENVNTCIHTINNKTDDPMGVKNISQLSWNCTGSVLAASFGEICHNKWCIHTSTGVAIYGLSFRFKAQLEDKPDSFLESTTCSCCVSFHHTIPSVLAAGTYNGELIIWDRSRSENDLLVTSNTDNKVHEDSIISIFWLQDPKSKTPSTLFQLISLSTDGIIVLWNLSMRKNILTPTNCYTLTARDLPKSVRYKGNMSRNLCILCGSLNSFDNEYVVVGTNIGSLFICRIQNKQESSNLTGTSDNNSPVDSVLGTISGAVHSVTWSNAVRYFIAAVSVDGLIHIYNSDQREQILTLDPDQGYLYDLSLSSLLHGIIATGGENRTIVLSDILAQNIISNNGKSKVEYNSDITSDKITLKIKESDNNTSTSPMNCVAFNDKNLTQVASSDMNGTIYIWQVGQLNSEQGSRARQIQLQEMLASATNG